MTLRSVSISRKSSPWMFFGALGATLVVLFLGRFLIDTNSIAGVMSSLTVPVHIKNHSSEPEGVSPENGAASATLCRLPQAEVYSDADFTGTGITPSELQGADSRWEAASMVRREVKGFVHGMGAASADEACT